jgi:hypothetical protein
MHSAIRPIASDPKVDSTFRTNPMLRFLSGASWLGFVRLAIMLLGPYRGSNSREVPFLFGSLPWQQIESNRSLLSCQALFLLNPERIAGDH